MLTFADCLGLRERSEEKIRAIAEHPRILEIVALELGNHLIRGSDGELPVSHIMAEAA